MLENNHQYLMPGMFIIPGKGEFHHRIGGSHDIDGATCPNCKKPLMLHLNLDAFDPRLHSIVSEGETNIPLLYCMRCSLCWHDFSYRSLDNSSRVIIIEQHCSAENTDCWEEIGVDEFAAMNVILSPIPGRLQELYDKLNGGDALTEGEEFEVARATERFASDEMGGYPIVDSINQVGGRAFMFQRLDDPPCPFCLQRGTRRQMRFLASLVNDDKHGIVFTFDGGVQIVFFMCAECRSVKVMHSI